MAWRGGQCLGDLGLVERCITARGVSISGAWLGGDGNQSP